MESININIDQPLVSTNTIRHYKERLASIIAHHANTPYPFVTIVYDKHILQEITAVAHTKKKLKPALLFVIGIGGSNLGALAITKALLGSYYNDTTKGMRIYYLDTVDTDYVNTMLMLAQKALSKGKTILINVISKSGNTTETIVNFELFLTLLKQYHLTDYSAYIVVTTDKNSSLWYLAHRQQWCVLEIPRELGGRYSLFCAAGLLPLAMLDIDIQHLVKGAQHASNLCLKQRDDIATNAAWQYALCKNGYTIHNLFLFSEELSDFGSWWRQLVAESLGKETKTDGSINQDAIFPIVSIGPTDLHSVGQFYFAGLTPITTTFVSFAQDQSCVTIEQQQDFDPLVYNVRGETLTNIMQAILQGVKQAYTIKQLPYRTIVIPEKNAYYMGQFLQLCMFEIVYIAYLMHINPFNQPAVELYKQQTRKILSNE